MLFFNVIYLITAAVSDKWLNLYHSASSQSDIIREEAEVVHTGMCTHIQWELNQRFNFIIFTISFILSLGTDLYFFPAASTVKSPLE